MPSYSPIPRSRCATGHEDATVCSHCGSLHFLVSLPCLLTDGMSHVHCVSAAAPVLAVSGVAVRQPTNKEQRKFGGQVLVGDPAMRQVRNNQSSLLRRPCPSLDKESHTTVVQRIIGTKNPSSFPFAIMAVLDSSYGAMGHCDLPLSRSMPVGQEACKILPQLSPRCLPFRIRRHCPHRGHI